jgi:DNA-binding XRE family transcriptional regulator
MIAHVPPFFRFRLKNFQRTSAQAVAFAAKSLYNLLYKQLQKKASSASQFIARSGTNMKNTIASMDSNIFQIDHVYDIPDSLAQLKSLKITHGAADIAKARVEAKLSQNDVAIKLDRTKLAIANIESGNCCLETLLNYTKVVGKGFCLTIDVDGSTYYLSINVKNAVVGSARPKHSNVGFYMYNNSDSSKVKLSYMKKEEAIRITRGGRQPPTKDAILEE